MLYTICHICLGRRAVHHRRRTAATAYARSLRAAVGVLLACCALGGTALAAAGGADKDPAAAVLQIARQQLGDPYAWGATGPDSWDCSGLTSRLWREVGGVASIPRVAADQQAWATPIPAEQLLPGDLVFFGNPVSHVAFYAGSGTLIDASSSQHGVVERKLWTSGVIRYGRVPRTTMPAVTPWTPPSPSASPSAGPSATVPRAAVAPSASPTARATERPGSRPTTSPVASPTPSAVRAHAVSAPAAVTLGPLRGLPAPDLAGLTTVAVHAAANARSVLGSRAWTDLELVRAAWRHAGGGVLPTTQDALVRGGVEVPVGAARVGDLVAYGQPASHLGVYLGHGFMVDTAPGPGRVVVRRVYASATVRMVRLAVR
jgi:cell wall-associated NlpC family hydrolase